MEITSSEGLGPQLNGSGTAASAAADNRQLIQAAKALNAAGAFGDQTEISFSIDRTTRLPMFKIIDRNTQEVVEQIPPEYILRLAAELGKKGA